MKRMVALALILAALLSMAALAETDASIIRMSDLSLAYVDGNGSRSVRFDGAVLTVALGEPGGIPTVQANFDNGNGQVVDAVLQLVDQQILLSMGGISSTYAVDLQAFAGEGNNPQELADGLRHTLSLAGAHLDVVLYAITREGENGVRSVQAPLPMPQLIGMAEALLAVRTDAQDGQDAQMNDVYARVEAMGEEAMLGFRYNPATGAFDLAAVQDGKGMCLSGTLQLSAEPVTFIDISADEERLDALNLTPEQMEDLRNELDMVMLKGSDFLTGMSAD